MTKHTAPSDEELINIFANWCLARDSEDFANSLTPAQMASLRGVEVIALWTDRFLQAARWKLDSLGVDDPFDFWLENEPDQRASMNDGEYFGWCPECGKTDGYRNIGRDHWFYCDAHRTRWRVGSNLFSSWREEDDATWEANARHLESYREVEGDTPTAAMLERMAKPSHESHPR